MKNDQYFNLEVSFLDDDNLATMMMKLDSAESLGVYMILLLHLRKKDDYVASCDPLSLEVIAYRYRLNQKMVEQVIFDYGLFEIDKEKLTFRSFYLDKVMAKLEEKRKINVENGKKGGRPRKKIKSAETPMDKGEKPNETQESRGEEKRSITTVVNNSSNTPKENTETAVAAVSSRLSSSLSSVVTHARPGSYQLYPHSSRVVESVLSNFRRRSSPYESCVKYLRNSNKIPIDEPSDSTFHIFVS